jgi:hypothetical protein
MTVFDGKQFVAALEAPAFVDLEGQTHTGRLLSHVEMSKHYEKLRIAYAHLDQDPEAVTRVMLEACEQMFDAAAVTALTAMPGVAVEAAMTDFFASHRPAAKTPSAAPNPTPTSA